MTKFDAPQPDFNEILTLHGKWLAAKPAVVQNTTTVTWAELDTRLNRVANGLIALGLRRGDRVAVVMDNSIAMIEAMFGILRAGGVIVPLNLSVPPEGMAAMLRDSAVSAIFADAGLTGRVDTVSRDLESLLAGARIAHGESPDGWTGFAGWRDAQRPGNPGIRVAPDDLFNIIYSSGTTGMPKGIAHAHARRTAFARDMAISLRLDTQARTLVTIGLYSNISMSSAIFTFLTGGTVCILDRFDPAAVVQAIEDHRITHILMVPIQFQMIWDQPGFGGRDLSSLRCILSVGSPLYSDLKRRIIDRVGPILIEAYGLTEGPLTIIDGEDCARLPGSVGKPILGTDIRIIDDKGREVPPGQDGEIVGRGPHTMPFYYNNQAATAETVWTCPEGRIWLRTGDLGRFDEDGFLFIVGRLKDMILSGGQNIYPSDIETVLITHPDVNDCAVIGIPHEKWGETPFAVVVPEPGAAPDPDSLRTWVNDRVGKRQRIAGVALQEMLPRNANGKVLKRDLREIYGKDKAV
ncbi:MAG: class I adenylate-forming enzyme family protein [Jhaorihella sp.]